MGLHFNHDHIQKANRIRSFIRNYASAIESTFQECVACNGTGLVGQQKVDQGGYNWGGEWCPVCEGTGYVDWKKANIFAICDSCKGSGGHNLNPCVKCDGKGVLDWVSAMRNGIKCEGLKNDRDLSR